MPFCSRPLEFFGRKDSESRSGEAILEALSDEWFAEAAVAVRWNLTDFEECPALRGRRLMMGMIVLVIVTPNSIAEAAPN